MRPASFQIHSPERLLPSQLRAGAGRKQSSGLEGLRDRLALVPPLRSGAVTGPTQGQDAGGRAEEERSLVTPRTSDAWDTRGFPHGRPCLLRRGLRDPARDLGPEAGRLTCRSPRCGRNATEKPGQRV